ncbi:hypothetical protein SK128_006655 [Halocaridina rubra]|uniref:Vitellogenin n=1 Tax=Halocaridina rubra TaxID=373956 RepID=A0AAN8X314_HALRR
MLDSSKLKYRTDTTYVYEYNGLSKTELKGVEGAITETQWKKKVLLSWLSPCEMAITFQDVQVDGTKPADKAADFLTKYPLVVAVTDGRVQKVCTHPNDDIWSINMKKSIASAFQISIPKLSPISNQLNVTETDIVGICPTRYEVEGEGGNTIVKKSKDLRLCHDRYPTAMENPTNWLKFPVPIERHWTKCKQEIKNGIYSKISCQDNSVVRPSVGALRYIKGSQESSIQYVSENDQAPESLSTIRGEYGFESLLFNHAPYDKDETKVPILEEKLKEVCEKTKESLAHDAAAVMSEIIHLLKRVPDNTLPQILEKIRSRHYCQQSQRLESMFLDAIAFTYDSASVKTMIQDLLQARDHGGREALYAAAMYFTAHPNIQAVESVGELFKSDKYMPSVFLSAGTMINRFCHNYDRHQNLHNERHRECHAIPQVNAIIKHLDSRLQAQCKVCDDDQTKESAFATLEAIGNIGIMTPEVAKSTLKCIETRGVDTAVQVSAIRAFRNAKCQRFATMHLVNIAVDPPRDTEVRISAYLSAMRCVQKTDLEEIIYKISKENNTQVRSFVFSHMLNIQKSTAPGKAHLRNLLTNFVIPTDIGQDIRKYSRNVDLSFYAPSIQLGGGMESNIIYAPGSFIPRSLSFNFSSLLYGERVHLGELGTRLEGVDELIAHLIGPASFLNKHSVDSIMEKVNNFIREKGHAILEHFMGNSRGKRSLDVTHVADMLKKIYNEGKPKFPRAEVYASIMGQDIAYTFFKGNSQKLDFNTVFDSYFAKLKQAEASLRNMRNDFARTSRLGMDYILPTILGAPLRIKFDGTAVVSLKMEGHLNIRDTLSNPGNSVNDIRMIPSFSTQGNGFVGYDCFLAKTGLQINNTISSNGGIAISVKTVQSKEAEIHLDLPENMDLLQIESETYLLKKKSGETEHVVKPSSVHDVRITRKSCINELESILGLKICYDVNVPDVFRSNGLPLVAKSTAKLHIEKAEHTLMGYRIKAQLQDSQESKVMRVKMETKGTSDTRVSEGTLSIVNKPDMLLVKGIIEGPGLKTHAWINWKKNDNEDEFEAFAEYESSERTISQGFKYKRTTTSSSNAHMTDISLYISRDKSFPMNSKILSLNFISRRAYKGSNIAVILKTENAMRNTVAMTFETVLDLETHYSLRIPVLKKLRRLELYLETFGWKMNAFVRKEREAQEDSVSISSLKLWHRSSEIFAYEATHTLRGNPNGQYNRKNEITVKVGESGCKIDQQTLFTHQKTGIILKIVPLSGGSHILDFEATLTNSQEGHTLLFLVDLPALMSPNKFELHLVPQEGQGKYELDLFLEHGNQKVFELTGPTTLILEESLNKLETFLQVTVLGHHLYKLQSHVEFSKERIIVLFDLANEHENIFLVEWKVGARNLHEAHIAYRVEISKFLKNRMDVITKPDKIEIVFDNLVLPESSYQRRIKGSVDILYLEKRSRIEFAWDADREPNKKFIVDSHLMVNPSQPGFAAIDSQLHYNGGTYKNRIEVHGEYFIHPTHGRNGIKFVLTNPIQRTFVIEVDSKLLQEGSQMKVDFLLSYKNADHHEYKFASIMELMDISGNRKSQFNGELRYVDPQLGESRMHIRMNNDASVDSKIDFDTEVHVEVPGTTPTGVSFILNITPVAWKNYFTLKTPSPSEMWAVNVEVYPRGYGLRIFDIKVDVRTIAMLMKNIRQIVVAEIDREGLGFGKENEIRNSFESERVWRSDYQEGLESMQPENSEEYERNDQYHLHYHSPTPTSKTLLFKTPNRTVEGGCHYAPTSLNVWFYPDKERSNAKYDVSVYSNEGQTSSGNEQELEWKGRISHPEYERDKEITLSYSSIGPLKSGSLVIDILPDSADKITATLSSNITTRNSMRIEASIVTRVLTNQPKLVVMTAYSPQVVGFDLSYFSSSSPEPSVFITGKYDNTTNKNVAIMFDIRNEGLPVFELSTIMRPEWQQPECYGLKMKGGLRIPVIGRYDVMARMCAPAYIEFSSKEHGSSRLYMAKLGVQYPNLAQVSIYTEDEQSQQKHHAVLARAQLTSPTTLKLDLAYEEHHKDAMMSDIGIKISKTFSPLITWLRRIKDILVEEAKAKGFEFPSKEYMRNVHIVYHETSAICREVGLWGVSLYEKFRDFLHSPTVSYIINVYYHVWSKMADVHRDFRTALTWTLFHVSEQFSDVFAPLGHALLELANMMTEKREPEFIKRLWQEFEESRVYRSVISELDVLHESYPVQYEALHHTWMKQNHALMKDLEKLRMKLMDQPPVQVLVHWIKHNMKADHVTKLVADDIISWCIREVLFVVVEKGTHSVQVEIPIHMPLHSLTQVLQVAKPYPTDMVLNMIWSFDTYITQPVQRLIQLRHMSNPLHITEWLPPFNGTAVLLSNTEILTFDRKVIRIPQTPCRIRLATIGHATVTMEHVKHNQHPRITLTHFTVKAVINPDFTAKLNGQEVRDRSSMMGVEVEVTEEEVRIISPFVSVEVIKNFRVVLVQASGWAFGKTGGVLGTFDGELENDMLMPTGVIATNAKEFVTSWQEDHNCQTPDVNPLHVPFSRMVACHVLVGSRSRCNPIIDPKPFLKMCYEAQYVCDAAKAYRTLCHKMGVREPYPLPC